MNDQIALNPFLECTICGTVKGIRGNPIIDADVNWDPFGYGLHFYSFARTDERGFFEGNIGPIPPGVTKQAIQVAHPGCEPKFQIVECYPHQTMYAHFTIETIRRGEERAFLP